MLMEVPLHNVMPTPLIHMYVVFNVLQTSFRELLPSESHRRKQAKFSEEQRHHRRSLSESEDFHSRGSSPSHGEGSRVPSPMPSELSPSPGAGEDSFFQVSGRQS